MSLKLTFKTAYPPVPNEILFPKTLPKLSIITGYNGSGKTRLLQAIASGAVLSETNNGVVSTNGIQYYNNRSLEPKTEWDSSIDYSSERDCLWTTLQQCCASVYQRIYTARADLKLPQHYAQVSFHMEQLEHEESKELANDYLKEYIDDIFKEVERLFIDSFTTDKNGGKTVQNKRVLPTDQDKLRGKIYKELKASGLETTDILNAIRNNILVSVFEWNKEQFIDNYPSDIQTNLFERSFSRWFTKYIDYQQRNESIRYNFEKQDIKDRTPLSEEEFVKRYGKEPWDVVDNILRDAGIDYRVTKPSRLPEDSYTAALEDPNGNRVELTELSSGEKVILSLFSSLSYATATDELKILPKILLLDEVDTSLHPSLTKFLITMLEKFCKERGIHIILTTHSPSTVALSKESSVHILKKEQDSSTLEATTIDAAVSLLTAGIPTLSVKQELRRPVFVESSYDANYYEELYKLYFDVSEERTSNSVYLHFIPAAGTHHGGCSAVKDQVKALRDAGNQTIFGIIDKDKSNKESEYIFIPGSDKNRRYSTENYLLDPIATCMYLLAKEKTAPEEIGLDKGTKYPAIPSLSKIKIEQMIKSFTKNVLGLGDNEEVRECTYGKGIVVNVPEKFLNHDGHKYENAHLTQKYDLKHHDLKKDVISTIYKHYPETIPSELFDLFSRIEKTK